MDVTAIAGQLAAVLVPLIPYLTGLGDKAVQAASERLGQQLGESALSGLTDLWDRLWPQLRGRPARTTVQRLAEEPDRSGRIDLAGALESVLDADPDLREAATALLRRHPDLGRRRWGDLAGTVSDSVILQGDGNVAQHGRDNLNISAGRDVSFRRRS